MPENYQSAAPLHRRLLAMIYDGLLLIAILFCTTMLYMTLVVVLTGPSPELLNAQEGDVITQIEPVPMGWPIIPVLLTVFTSFYSYFWIQSGQTLGMQAWKIKLQSDISDTPDLRQCLLRLLFAVPSILFFGVGYWIMLFNSSRSTWLDQASKTRVVNIEPHSGK